MSFPNFVYANNVLTTLAAPITTTTQTTITLASAAGLPTITAGQTLVLTLNDAATGLVFEIIYVTARTGAVLTGTRGQEGTAAATWIVGDNAFCGVTAEILSSFAQASVAGSVAVDTSNSSQTKTGALSVTGGLTSGAGVAVGGTLTGVTSISMSGPISGATTGNFAGNVTVASLTAASAAFSGDITAAGATIGGDGVTITSNNAFGLHVTQAPTNGVVVTPLTNSQLGTMVVTNAAGSSTLLELNQVSATEMQLVIAGILSSSNSTAYSDVSAAAGDNVGQRSTASGAIYLGGAGSAGQLSWNVQTSGQFTLTENFVGFAKITGGTYTTSSDASLKTNVKPVKSATDTVLALKPVTFDWKDDGSSSLGFLAQDIEAILPALVTTTNDGTKGVAYHGFAPILVAAVQDMNAKLKAAGVAGF